MASAPIAAAMPMTAPATTRDRLARLAEIEARPERGMIIPQNRWAWLPLGQMLINDKVLTPDQLNQALERQRKTRERLGQILIDMKLIDEDITLRQSGFPQAARRLTTLEEVLTVAMDAE